MPNLTFYYSHWDYWQLYHKVTFDGVNKLILVNPGETSLDIQVDVYSAWKQWALQENNLKYLNPFSTVGGEPTIEGQRLDVTYFLINGWKIKPYTGTYDLTLVGNIFDIDGFTFNIFILESFNSFSNSLLVNSLSILPFDQNVPRLLTSPLSPKTLFISLIT